MLMDSMTVTDQYRQVAEIETQLQAAAPEGVSVGFVWRKENFRASDIMVSDVISGGANI